MLVKVIDAQRIQEQGYLFTSVSKECPYDSLYALRFDFDWPAHLVTFFLKGTSMRCLLNRPILLALG